MVAYCKFVDDNVEALLFGPPDPSDPPQREHSSPGILGVGGVFARLDFSVGGNGMPITRVCNMFRITGVGLINESRHNESSTSSNLILQFDTLDND